MLLMKINVGSRDECRSAVDHGMPAKFANTATMKGSGPWRAARRCGAGFEDNG
jgi:hypothetical protein